MPYPDKFYPVVDSVAWVARLALLGAGTIQLRAKNLNESEALQAVTDALEVIRGTSAKLVVNDYWRAAIVAGAKHLHLGQEDLAELSEADLAAIRAAGLTLGLSTHDDEELEELDRHDDEEDRHEEELLEDLQLDDDEELLLLDEEDNDIELELKPVAMSPKAMEIEFQNPNPEVAVKAMILLAFGMGRSLVSFRSVVTKIFALSVCPNPGVIFTPDTLDIKLTSIELVDKVVISVIISLLTPLSLLMASTIRANCITL